MSAWVVASARDTLKWYLNLASPTRPTQFWLGLSASSADPAVGWAELAVANYARQQITWNYAGDVYATNTNQLDFANLGLGSVLGQGIWSASTAGTLLFWSDLSVSLGFATGHTISYSAGLIKVGAVLS